MTSIPEKIKYSITVVLSQYYNTFHEMKFLLAIKRYVYKLVIKFKYAQVFGP